MLNRRQFIRNLGAGAVGVMVVNVPFNAFSAGDYQKITILHTNDFHSHIDPFPNDAPRNAGEGGMAKRASLISKIRTEEKNVLLLDAGDIYQGSPYFNYFKGELEFKLMTQMGYDAATIGNHEFDNGLEGIESQLKHAGFPFITSNYDFSDTILAGKTIPYKIFRRNGIKVGVYGLCIELDGLVSKKNYGNTKYLDPLVTALKMEKMLKEERPCDLVICLSHLGFSYKEDKISDKIIAAETSFTDLIIGGHTHTFLQKPDELINKAGRKVLVNQVGYGGLILGRIDFYLSKDRKTRKEQSENLSVK
jgi:5'-nucleotidase